MGQEHRPERRMGDWVATTEQFSKAYLGGPPPPQPTDEQKIPHIWTTWDWRDIPPKNPHENREGPPDMPEPARLPKKPKPTRPIGNARVE